MDIRQLQCFVAVAEELHFGRAAARLHLSQPPLSQRIKALETQLGVQLFERDRRSVRLTAAGRALLAPARAALRTTQEVARAVRQATLGEAGELRVGYSGSVLYAAAVVRALAAFRRRHPAVAVELDASSTGQSVQALEDGRLDAAFVRGPLPTPAPAWPAARVQHIVRERLLVALPRAHPLVARRHLVLATLHDERFLAVARRLGTALNARLAALFASAGFQPDVTLETADMAALLGLVAAGAGIAVVPEAVASFRPRYVAFRPLADADAWTDLYLLLPQHPAPAALHLATLAAAAGAQTAPAAPAAPGRRV